MWDKRLLRVFWCSTPLRKATPLLLRVQADFSGASLSDTLSPPPPQ